MDLKRVRDALLTVGVPVSHYEAAKQEDKYIVWAEEGQGAGLSGDGRMKQQAISGSAVYYTREEYDPNVEAVQKALNDADIAFFLASAGRDENTGLIFYAWSWEVPNGEI